MWRQVEVRSSVNLKMLLNKHEQKHGIRLGNFQLIQLTDQRCICDVRITFVLKTTLVQSYS